MDAPKCRACGKRHYSTQPCAINRSEERLTDAINEDDSAINTLAPSPIGAKDEASRHTRELDAVRGVRQDSANAEGLPQRTPNRRKREDYNAYMRGYMTRRRSNA